jgi:uncharacterized membrane protein YphA (DoxX/SURF4 family)
MNEDKQRDYAILILRVGLALVFLYFGVMQLINPAQWTRLLPGFTSSMPQETLIMLNGVFEVIFGLLLLVGFMTRWVAALLAIHLASITVNLGYTAIGVRDFGLTLATIALALYNNTKYSVDGWRSSKSGRR